ERILQAIAEARGAEADLVLLPELAVTSYPPEDLLLRPGFIRAAEESLQEIARQTSGLVALVGFPHFDRDLYNACAVCAEGEVKAVYRKRFLPNYGVFDEDRYFAPARDCVLLELGGTLVGPTIDRARSRRRAAADQHLRLAVSRPPRPRAGGDVRHARTGQRVLRRFLQRRRRAGRADLRRPLARPRRGGPRARACARVRGGATGRGHRSGRRGRPPAAGRPAARA